MRALTWLSVLTSLLLSGIAAAQGVTLPEFERVELENGTVLILLHKPDVPLVSVSATLRGGAVTPGYFETLGVELAAGRPFHADEADPGGPAVVVFSHHVWEQAFGADPEIEDDTQSSSAIGWARFFEHGDIEQTLRRAAKGNEARRSRPLPM